MSRTPAVLNIVELVRDRDTVSRNPGYWGRPHRARKLLRVAVAELTDITSILAQDVRSSRLPSEVLMFPDSAFAMVTRDDLRLLLASVTA
jgi:hypothetical protein